MYGLPALRVDKSLADMYPRHWAYLSDSIPQHQNEGIGNYEELLQPFNHYRRSFSAILEECAVERIPRLRHSVFMYAGELISF